MSKNWKVNWKKRKSKQERIKERRTKLYNENPFCPECDTKMILPEEIGFVVKNNGLKNLKYTPDNLCTLEHKYSKINPDRKKPCKELRWSILCFKCNREKGLKDVKSILTIEEERVRSKMHKKMGKDKFNSNTDLQ